MGLKLTVFFQPLNFLTISYTLGLLIFFDILGTFLKPFFIKVEKADKETRLINWLLGFGFFIFVWFLLGFIVQPTQNNILLTILILSLISLPSYVKHKKYIELFGLVKPLGIPMLIILPFIPSLFVKASLPPYYSDEMAYHFISPYSMLNQLGDFWKFASGGLYQNTVRLIDLFYILGFSLTRTYSVTRLIQFTILATSFFEAYLLLKKYFGFIPAFLFLLIFFSLPQEITFAATIGYVDVPAYSFTLLGLFLSLAFFMSRQPKYFILSIIFWALSIGSKYTSLQTMAVFMVILVIVYGLTYKSLKILSSRRVIVPLLIGFIIFGGYWYIKNFILFGNPVYPFLFHCWGKYAIDCSKGSSFFTGWTMPINSLTFYPIVQQLLPVSKTIYMALLITPFLIFLSAERKKIIPILSILIGTFFGELLILKYFSGFYIRYQQHMQLVLILITVLISAVKFRKAYLKAAQILIVGAVFWVTAILYLRTIAHTNSIYAVSRQEINYALGRTNIYDWIRQRIPTVTDATIWCENPPNPPVFFPRYDPDMIWFDDAGFMRSYLVGCSWGGERIDPEGWENALVIAKEKKLQFWTVSPNPCILQKDVKGKQEVDNTSISKTEKEHLLFMRKLNNVIVCNSQEVLPNLYYFDYKKLK